MSLRFFIFLALFAAGCQSESSHEVTADARARQLFGLPAPYNPDLTLADKLTAMNGSQSIRRTIAWQIVQRIFVSTKFDGHEIPGWLTWYPSDEVARLFAILWHTLDSEQRASGNSILTKQLRYAAETNRDYLWTLPHWTRERFELWRNNFDSASRLGGAAGLARALYNETAAYHLLRQHHNLRTCRTTPDRCGIDEFPVGSVVVKASWKRLRSGVQLKAYDTSPDILAKHFIKGAWQPDYHYPSQMAQGLKLTLGDSDYLLTGLHIMSKETKDWVWITLWWSPSASAEFREQSSLPSSLQQHYRMCVTTSFKDSEAALDTEDTTSESLSAIYLASPGSEASWCSNPYIEEGDGNSRTNCIGCHQYAGTERRSEDILKLPWHGVKQTLDQFATDYVFGINSPPDNLALKFHQ
jgi:hypothetical protein